MSTLQRSVLITGASRGLGLALARALARLGWNLLITGRGAQALESARLELSRVTRVIAIAGDITDPTHRARLLEASTEFGRLDALINNASTLGTSPLPSTLQLELAVYEEILQTNLLAPLAMIQLFAARLWPGARIINVTSDAASGAYAGWGAYGSSKAALEQLSNVLAVEQLNWKIYWVDPGDMRTQMQQEAFPGEDISDRPLPESSVPGFLELLQGELPSGRYEARALALAAPAGGI